mgnify:FL=1|tara:strand:- start:580 stop:768 length:189 start_codon:yes stop_codon:yes gene_type:complete
MTLKVNTLSKVSGNNITLNHSLNLKSYTTTARDSLTSAAGDMIYNSTTNKIQFYNGSAWNDF